MAITRRRARQFIDAVLEVRKNVSDELAYNAPFIYPEWKAETKYEAGNRVLYNHILYTVLLSHTSQIDWKPDVSPSLFAKVLITSENDIPNWEQPNSTNPYMINDKVKHNNKIWKSTVNNNVWEPGYYGWEEVE